MRRYNLNRQFFDTISTERQAYWLGFLAADGHVEEPYRVRLRLAARDTSHVSKFRQDIDYTGPLEYRQARCGGKLFNQAVLSVSSKEFVAGLVKHGVTARKSLNAEAWSSASADLQRHYWRGVFDGDGSIGINCIGSLVMTLVGSEHMIRSFYTFSGVGSVRKRHNIYQWYCYSWRKGLPVAKRLYDGSTVALERKLLVYNFAKEKQHAAA